MKKSRTKKVLSIVLAASMLLAMGVTAFAAETTETDTKLGGIERQGRFKNDMGRGQMMRPAVGENLLNELIENGTISESDAEAIQAYVEEQRKLPVDEKSKVGDGEGPLVSLVEEGVISQKTADDITGGIELLKEEKRNEFVESVVDKGILTEAEMQEVIEFMDECREERAGMRDELSEMTRDERREYLQENKEDLQRPLEKMIDAGIIDADQAEALKDLMPGNGRMGPEMGQNKERLNMERGPKDGTAFGNRNGGRLNSKMNCEEL